MKIRKELWFGFTLMALIVTPVLMLDAVGQPGRRAPDARGPRHARPADARADRGGDHARLPHRVHADGHGRVLRLARLPQRQPRPRRPADARPDGAARLRGDVERRADRDPAVRLHGLPGRARGADRPAVQEPAPRAGARARLARGGDDRHLRDLRHRHRHRRRGGDADGPARVPGDAEAPATTSRSPPASSPPAAASAS